MTLVSYWIGWLVLAATDSLFALVLFNLAGPPALAALTFWNLLVISIFLIGIVVSGNVLGELK